MSAERESLFDVLRQKRQFIPGGFRDEDGVWHDGPHQVEFDAGLEALEGVVRSVEGFAVEGLIDRDIADAILFHIKEDKRV